MSFYTGPMWKYKKAMGELPLFEPRKKRNRKRRKSGSPKKRLT